MFCKSISKCFRVTDPNCRVDATVIAKVDGRTDERTNEQKNESLNHTMPEAGTTKTVVMLFLSRICKMQTWVAKFNDDDWKSNGKND